MCIRDRSCSNDSIEHSVKEMTVHDAAATRSSHVHFLHPSRTCICHAYNPNTISLQASSISHMHLPCLRSQNHIPARITHSSQAAPQNRLLRQQTQQPKKKRSRHNGRAVKRQRRTRSKWRIISSSSPSLAKKSTAIRQNERDRERSRNRKGRRIELTFTRDAFDFTPHSHA